MFECDSGYLPSTALPSTLFVFPSGLRRSLIAYVISIDSSAITAPGIGLNILHVLLNRPSATVSEIKNISTIIFAIALFRKYLGKVVVVAYFLLAGLLLVDLPYRL